MDTNELKKCTPVLTIKQIADTLKLNPKGLTEKANRQEWEYREEKSDRGGKPIRYYNFLKLPEGVQLKVIKNSQGDDLHALRHAVPLLEGYAKTLLIERPVTRSVRNEEFQRLTPRGLKPRSAVRAQFKTTSSSGFQTGRFSSITALITVNTAVFAPMPSASERTATAVNPGLLPSTRTP